MVEYETIIGLEVHVQLLTQSKMFCGCTVAYADAPPNTRVCPVCLGMPGVLPVINRRALEYTVMTGLALNCRILELSRFHRKNYPYPDLMKGYQISQYDQPLCQGGSMIIEVNGEQKRVSINRVHLEEDTAKLVHRSDPSGESYSLVDVNRSGVPLMEVVGEPDLRSPEEARQYLVKLRRILQYLGVSTGNMEEGSFRCDANISIRPKGTTELLGKVEVKNMNSFRAVYRALEHEGERQRQLVAQGGRVPQETRGWVDETEVTVSQRSKEYAHDYRYFPEPDLPPLVLSPAWVEELRARLPELPEARRDRLMAEYGLSKYDAGLLTATKVMAEFFEQTVAAWGSSPTISGKLSEHSAILPWPGKKSMIGNPSEANRAKHVSNWLLGEFSRLMNANALEPEDATKRIQPQSLAELLEMVLLGSLTGTTAKVVFEEMFHTRKDAPQIVSERELTQISAAQELAEIVEQVLTNNSQGVADYLGGKKAALGFLTGQVMRETRGRANPEVVSQLLLEQLSIRGG